MFDVLFELLSVVGFSDSKLESIESAVNPIELSFSDEPLDMPELDSVFVVFPFTVVFETPVVVFPVNDWVLLESVKLLLV